MEDEIEVKLYCDEIREEIFDDPTFGREKWMYIGILVVPTITSDQLLADLLNERCGPPSRKEWGLCPKECEFHGKNNKEVHYSSSDSADEYHIACRWLEYMLADSKNTFFYILGINLTNLDYKYFSNNNPTERFNSIYNRFFRSSILGALKYYFFEYKKIIIKNIVHDVSDLENDEYFPWHSIFKIKADDKILIECDRIEFLESDHKKSNDPRSHFLQYIDIILGSMFNSLHWQSQDEKKTNLAEKIYPLLERLMCAPFNKKSSYLYFRRKTIDFFPSKKVPCLKNLEQFIKMGGYYKIREARIKRKYQPSLF